MDTTTTTQTQDLEHDDPHCLPGETLRDLFAAAPWRRVLVAGDSIAAGEGDAVPGYGDRSWADRLADALAAADPGSAFLNLGQRQLVAAEIRDRQLRAALDFEPDLAVVTAGANDMLRRSFDPAALEPVLHQILGALTRSGCLIVTFGLFDLSRTTFVPDGMRADLQHRLARLNELTGAVCERHGGVHVDFFDHPALDDSLFSADMIHPNRRGHAYIAADVARALAARHRAAGEGPR